MLDQTGNAEVSTSSPFYFTTFSTVLVEKLPTEKKSKKNEKKKHIRMQKQRKV